MNIIFDLDGTLVDSSERMYQIFVKLMPKISLSKKEYWSLKRDGIAHRDILKMCSFGYASEVFEKEWISLIEKDNYLLMDYIYPDTIRILKYLKKKYQIYLLTARQSLCGVIDELERFKILDYFNELIVTGGKKKEEVLNTYILTHPFLNGPRNIFINDMGKDILFAKEHRYVTIGVSHGFMSRSRLAEYRPDFLIDTLAELFKIL